MAIQSKKLNGHLLHMITTDEERPEFVVWCRTCDPEGVKYIFQRDILTRDDQVAAVQDGIVQAKVHAQVDLTSN